MKFPPPWRPIAIALGIGRHVLTRATCGAVVLVVASATLAQPRVDLALIDGAVITVDGRDTVAQAIAIGDGVIVAVGTTAEILAQTGADARVIDLAGKSVMPTLI